MGWECCDKQASVCTNPQSFTRSQSYILSFGKSIEYVVFRFLSCAHAVRMSYTVCEQQLISNSNLFPAPSASTPASPVLMVSHSMCKCSACLLARRTVFHHFNVAWRMVLAQSVRMGLSLLSSSSEAMYLRTFQRYNTVPMRKSVQDVIGLAQHATHGMWLLLSWSLAFEEFILV